MDEKTAVLAFVLGVAFAATAAAQSPIGCGSGGDCQPVTGAGVSQGTPNAPAPPDASPQSNAGVPVLSVPSAPQSPAAGAPSPHSPSNGGECSDQGCSTGEGSGDDKSPSGSRGAGRDGHSGGDSQGRSGASGPDGRGSAPSNSAPQGQESRPDSKPGKG